MAASLALFAVFILRERLTPHPLVDLSLFRTGRFSRGIGTGLLCYLVLFGVLFVTPLYLEVTPGLPSAQAVLMLTVLPVALALAAPAAGMPADRFGIRLPTSVAWRWRPRHWPCWPLFQPIYGLPPPACA